MSRWWDDPAVAVAACALVDDSDVAQGVGTAALAYHALAKGALAPLLGSTLVDRADVAAALAGVDLSPVAKALGEATRPLLGLASDTYGQLLATQVHADAVDGVDLLLTQWRELPMPVVLARAAEVVGAPPRRLAVYAKVGKAERLEPLVAADAADRALMEWAAHFGSLEATGAVPVTEVSKDMSFEQAHPRNEDGEFAFKGDPGADRKARMARRARLMNTLAEQDDEVVRQRQEKAAQQQAAARATGGQPLRDVGRSLQRVMARGMVREAPRAVGRAQVVAESAPVAQAAEPAVEAENAYLLSSRHVDERQHGFIVDEAVAQRLLSMGRFDISDLRQAINEHRFGQNRNMTPEAMDQLFAATQVVVHPTRTGLGQPDLDKAHIEAQMNGTMNTPGRPVMLYFEGPLAATKGDFEDRRGIALASSARYEMTRENMSEVMLPPIGAPPGAAGPEIPAYHLKMLNPRDFPKPTPNPETRKPPHRLSKSHQETFTTDDGPRLVLVSRDADGQFAQADSSGGPARKARMVRRARLMEMLDDQAAPPPAMPAPNRAMRRQMQREMARHIAREQARELRRDTHPAVWHRLPGEVPRETGQMAAQVEADESAALKDFAKRRAVGLSTEDFTILTGISPDPMDLTPRVADPGPGVPTHVANVLAHPKSALQAAHEVVALGHGTRMGTGEGSQSRVGKYTYYATREEADAEAQSRNEVRAQRFERRVRDARLNDIFDEVEPSPFISWTFQDPQASARTPFRVVNVRYEPTVLVLGDDAALAALGQGAGNVTVSRVTTRSEVMLVPKGTVCLGELESEYGLAEGSLGPYGVPVMAYEATLRQDVAQEDPDASVRQNIAERAEANEWGAGKPAPDQRGRFLG